MSLVLTQEGAMALWRQMLGYAPGIGTPIVHLLGFPFTPLHSSILIDFVSNELGTAGYVPQPLTNGLADWAITPIQGGAQALHVPLSFGMTADCTVYGYFLADQVATHSIWGEQFAAPFSYHAALGPFFLSLIPNLVSIP